MFPVDSSEVPAQTSEAVQKGSAKQILVRPEPGPAQTQTHREHGQDPAMPHHKRTIVAPCLVVIHFLFFISICDGVMTCAFPTCNVWFNYRSEKHQRLMSGREQLQALGFPAISSFGGAPWLRSRPSMTNHIKDQRFYHCVEHQKIKCLFETRFSIRGWGLRGSGWLHWSISSKDGRKRNEHSLCWVCDVDGGLSCHKCTVAQHSQGSKRIA